MPAYYKGMPDTVDRARTTRSRGRRTRDEARPRARARRRDRPRPCKDVAPTTRRELRLRLHDLERHVGARRAGAASCRSAWARARPRTGTARTSSGPCIVTADEFDASRRRSCACASTASVWGEDTTRPHAPHLRRHDRLRLARPDAAPGRGHRVRHGRRRIGPRARPLARGTGDVVELESRASASCATPHRTKGSMTWHTSSPPSGGPRRARRTGCGGHPRDDPAVARGARQPLLPGAALARDPRTLLPLRAVRRRGRLRGPPGLRALHAARQGGGDPDLLEDREREFYETIDDTRLRERRSRRSVGRLRVEHRPGGRPRLRVLLDVERVAPCLPGRRARAAATTPCTTAR